MAGNRLSVSTTKKERENTVESDRINEARATALSSFESARKVADHAAAENENDRVTALGKIFSHYSTAASDSAKAAREAGQTLSDIILRDAMFGEDATMQGPEWCAWVVPTGIQTYAFVALRQDRQGRYFLAYPDIDGKASDKTGQRPASRIVDPASTRTAIPLLVDSPNVQEFLSEREAENTLRSHLAVIRADAEARAKANDKPTASADSAKVASILTETPVSATLGFDDEADADADEA